MMQPCTEKIYINLNTPPAFNLRQKILGDQNANLQYIVNETKANVSLRGRGSCFIEPTTGLESPEPMHFYLEHPVLKSLIEAKNLARNLLETVQQELQVFLQSNPTSQQNVTIQQPPPIIQTTQSITIPSSILSVPPPNIMQNNNMQPTHIIQGPNFLPQSQMIPQQMQIIQQSPLSMPPPNGMNLQTVRTATPISVQFQGQQNIQLQQAGQPILVNQINQGHAPQYQLQYIPANPIGSSQPQTIQHFIQPQQQIQGIIHPNTQQFITLQGNTAFMLPPPNVNSQNLGTMFNVPPITINPDDLAKNEANKGKSEETKSAASSQQLATSSRSLINQPPPPIQQFLVNANPWPQNQQIQQMPIQILTQPQQTIRNGNEILLQNTIPTAQGQQVIAAFAPQQGHPIQQIQFTNQPIISQPPPLPSQIQLQNIETQQQTPQSSLSTIIRSNHPVMSYQQQFEQKVNLVSDNQRRPMKRKGDETEDDPNKSFPKVGMGLMTKSRPPPPMHPNQQLIKVNSSNIRMITNPNVNTSSTSADNISVLNSKNNNNKHIFTKANSTASVATKTNVSQADAKAGKSSNQSDNDFSEVTTSSTASSFQNFELQPQFMQPPPNIQINQPRGIPPQMMMYQTQLPPPPIQQQQDFSVFQNNNNFMQPLNVNRFNVPRGMILQMNPLNDNSALIANPNFPPQQQQQQQQPRFRPQW